MIDIYGELTAISVAKYGLELRLPVWRALKKIDKVYNITGLSSLADGFAKSPTGDATIHDFIQAYILIRDVIRGSRGDEAAAKLYTDTYGYDIKSDIYTALKGSLNPDESIERYSLNAPSGLCYVIAGNDEPMFKVRGLVTLQDGISFYGKDGGVGVLNPDTNKYEYTMRVSNVFTGTFIDYQTISRDEKLGADNHITFYTRDEVTVAVDPGLIKIEILDYDGNVYSEGYIKSEVYKFGMAPAEGYVPTGDDDYCYISDSNSSTTLSYLGNDIMIKTPTVLGGQPLKTIGNTTFGYFDLIEVKIQEGVETIE